MSEHITSKLQLAVTLHQTGRLREAQIIYQEILKAVPNHFDALHLSGVIALQTGKLDQGLRLIDRALRANPASAPAHNNRGNALKALGRSQEALESYDRALSLRPDYADAYSNRGNMLLALGRPDDALAAFDTAVSLSPNDPEIHNNRANALNTLGRMGEALAGYDKALTLRPGYAEAHNNRGNVLLDLNRPAEALAGYERALALKPDYAEALNNRGNALRALERLEDALASYDKALALDADYAEAQANRGNILLTLKRVEEAVAAYRRALVLAPGYEFLFGTYLHARMMLCDWKSLGKDLERAAADIARAKKVATPWAVVTLFDDPGLQKIAAEVFTAAKYPQSSALGPYRARAPGGKIRIGYYSADFHNHATAYLMAELIEKHDPARFEIYGFSFGPDKTDAMRKRLSAAFGQFFEVSGKTGPEIARMSRDLGIDIAVDLKGATEGARTGIFAAGAAPIQVSYLGYPGTMGARYIDYIVADKTLIPAESRSHFTEQVAYLPYSYQVNDTQRKIADRTFTKAALGLPETGFVFCCFNAAFKITPETFDVWMRVLRAVGGSVLWLLADNDTAKANLRREAQARGVDAGRLIFAPRMGPEDHLARHRLADLFLDTWPCNAHTTASDALWAGLPVLTCRGHSFVARVAASLVNAVGLPELVTETPSAYEAKAIELASHPERLSAMRRTLEESRKTSPLFDSRLFARHIESAYETMFARHRDGVPPAVIEVQP